MPGGLRSTGRTIKLNTKDDDVYQPITEEIEKDKTEKIGKLRSGETVFGLSSEDGWNYLQLESSPYITKLTIADKIDENSYFYYNISTSGDRASLIKKETNMIGMLKKKVSQIIEEYLTKGEIIFQVAKTGVEPTTATTDEQGNQTAAMGGRKSRRSRKSRKQRKSRRSRR
jgi:hypothetical protein